MSHFGTIGIHFCMFGGIVGIMFLDVRIFDAFVDFNPT